MASRAFRRNFAHDFLMNTDSSTVRPRAAATGRDGAVRSRDGSRRAVRRGRQGAAVVEFALVAPVFFLLILGAVEFGRVVMVKQVLTNAAREGARRAILEHAAASDVQAFVAEYANAASVPGATVTVSPTDLPRTGFGESVSVTASVPFHQISWLPSPAFLENTNLSATSVMTVERPE